MAREWMVVIMLLSLGCDGVIVEDSHRHIDVARPSADAAIDADHPTSNAMDAEPLNPTDSGNPDTSPPCSEEMVLVDDFCMDRYEAPNVAGAAPLAMQTASDGEVWCGKRGKALCTEAQWVRACEGTTTRAFPYGNEYERGRCNDDKIWRSPNWTVLASWPSAGAQAEAERLYQADASGARVGCESEEGAFDLSANVAEWVQRSFAHANNYDHVLKGCYWAGCYGGAPPSCAFTNSAHPGEFRTYEAGFRCCSSTLTSP